MVDQKVAIIIAVCLLIISFVWRPGAWVRISEKYEVDRPFRIKVGNQYAYLNDSDPNDPNARFWLTPDVSRAGIFRATPTPERDGYTVILWVGNGSGNAEGRRGRDVGFLSHRGNNYGWVYADQLVRGNDTLMYHWKEDNGKLVPHIDGKGTKFVNDGGIMKLKVVDIQQADTFQFEYIQEQSQVPGIPDSFFKNLDNAQSAADVERMVQQAGYASQLQSWMNNPRMVESLRRQNIDPNLSLYEKVWRLMQRQRQQQQGPGTYGSSSGPNPAVTVQSDNAPAAGGTEGAAAAMKLGPGTISGGPNPSGQTTQPMPIPGGSGSGGGSGSAGSIGGGPRRLISTATAEEAAYAAARGEAAGERRAAARAAGVVSPQRRRTRGRSSYVQPEQSMSMMTSSSTDDDYKPHNYCDSAWWSGSCSASADLDFEAVGTPLDRPRDQPVPTENEYAPMSPDGSRRVLGSDGPKETLPFTSAWDNTNEINTENGGSASLSQTQLAQIRGSAAADLLGMDIQFPMQPMRPGIPA